MILFIELFANVERFLFLDFHQSVWVIDRNKKDEKVLKHSSSIGRVLFHISVM